MAFHHHLQNNHQTTTTTTCCCHSPPLPQPPPYTTADPLTVATIVTQFLQSQSHSQTPLHFLSQPSTNHPTLHPKQNYPLRDSSDPFHFQHPSSILSSLLHRIDSLEASLHRFNSSSSSSSCLSLRDAAARIIQTHFRSYLVRRSRTLRQLKHLASIKSTLTSLKSSFSLHGFSNFDSFSRKATDLLLHLDSIQSGDQMINDSKRSISREIVQFLEMVDGVCVRKHQVLAKTMKNMRMGKNNCKVGHDGLSSNGRKLISNLRERVERIDRMSKALRDEDVDTSKMEGFEHIVDENGDIIDHVANNYPPQNGVSAKKNYYSNPSAKKRVCFVEDGNVIEVDDVDGDIRRSRFLDSDEIDYSSKGRQDEEEGESDCDGSSSQGSKDGKSHHNRDGEFTFAAPEPLKMESRAKPGVKIVG